MFGIVVQAGCLRIHDGEGAFSVVECRHYRVPDAFLVVSCRLETVDDQFDEMGLVPVQLGDFRKVFQFSVNADLCVAAPAELVEQFFVMTFTAFDQRGQEVTFPSPVIFYDEVYYLLVGVTDHLPAGGRGVGS